MNIPYVMKRCTCCGRWLVASTVNFRKKKTNKYGLYSQCRKCEKKYKKQWQEANKDKIAKYGKQYREVNKEKITEQKNNITKLTKIRYLSDISNVMKLIKIRYLSIKSNIVKTIKKR